MALNEKPLTVFADITPTRIDEIKKNYPRRVFNFRIAECNMPGAVAALANEGFIPLVFGFSCFLTYKALEFIRFEVCRQRLNVKLIGANCGVIGNKFGPTHHSTEDIAALHSLPNLTLLSPASAKEVAPVLEEAVSLEGPRLHPARQSL